MKRKYIAISVLLLLLIGFSVFKINNEPSEIKADEKTEEKIKEVEKIYVEIKGAVVKPGIYEFNKEVRLFEVINQAGGLIDGANIDYINQTRIMKDQMLVVILTNEQIALAKEKQELGEIGESQVIEVDTSVSEINGYDNCYCKQSASGIISLNNASVEELMTLNGIGESKANAIISYRETNGGFKSIDELKNVDGIGDATFNKIKDSISL